MDHSPQAAPCRARRLLLLITLFTVCTGCTLHAQTADTTKYRYFRPYDTVFRLVGTNIANWAVTRDLGLHLIREYSRKKPDDYTRLMNSTSTEPYDTARRFFYRNAIDSGVKVITPIEHVEIDLKSVRSVEHYARANDTLYHNLDLKDVSTWGKFPKAMHDLVYGVTVPSGGGDTLVAGGPRYVSTYALFYSDSLLYKAFGAPDRSGHFRVSFAFRADDIPSDLDTSTVLASFLMYRRTREGQHQVPGDDSIHCRCEAFIPFDTVKITRSMYDNPALTPVVDSLDRYREFGKTYNFVLGTELRTFDSTITVDKAGGGEDTVFRRQFYEPDTVTGFEMDAVTLRDAVTDQASGRRVRVTGRHIKLSLVGLREHHTLDWLYGDGDAYFGGRTCLSDDTCRKRAARGDFGPGAVIMNDLFASDLTFEFHSTRRVPITFLRSRINQDLYDSLRAGRLDSAVIAPGVASIYSDANLVKLLDRVAYSDETSFHKFRADGVMARKIQDFMRKNGDTTRQLWLNPPGNFHGTRVMEEDLDTTRVRTVQMLVRQDYHQVGGPDDGIPIYYVNPDSMGTFAINKTFRPTNKEGVTFKMIVGHDDAGYAAYNARRQAAWGSVTGAKSPEASGVGALVPTLWRAVDAARFRYQQFGPPPVVWNAVAGMGWRPIYDPVKVPVDTGAVYPPWATRPATPEEITGQVWLSLGCGVTGLNFVDAQIGPDNWGYVNEVSGIPRHNYETWYPEKALYTHDDSLKFMQDSMWTGFLDRYDAVRRSCRELRVLDANAYIADWLFNQKQMSVHEPTEHFTDMPLVDTLVSEKADRAVEIVDSAFVFRSTHDMEPKGETYIDLSHFMPSPRDPHRNAQYFLVTNRRCWPIDLTTYGDKAQAHGAQPRGLGAIDVRRPWVRFKHMMPTIGDSLLVERVGHEARVGREPAWAPRRIAPDSLLALDWLAPGWGTVYRVTPIPAGISRYGTAWNNATHAENPSNDSVARPRVVVYERDSAVYVRALDTDSLWTREWIVSNPRDTEQVTVWDAVKKDSVRRRRAHNIFPAFAAGRGDEATFGHTPHDLGGMIAWERRDSANRATVEILYMNELPSRSGDWTNDTLHRRLTRARPLVPAWKQLIPAITAVEHRGFVVAWGSPDTFGIELIGVRSNPGLDRWAFGDLDATDTTRTMRAWMSELRNGKWWPADSMCQFPTLAYRRNWTTIVQNGGTKGGAAMPVPPPPPPVPGDPIIPADTSSYHVVHLAYQQGYRTNEKWQIMYNTIGVDFANYATGTPRPPRIWVSTGENVSNGITACEHIHPSIAADSGYVAVAWETRLGVGTITLRFRDPIVPVPGYSLVPIEQRRTFWSGSYFRWGDINMAGRGTIFRRLREYATPSLAHYPALRRGQLRGVPEGALTWQWTNAPLARRNRLVLYRYGETGPDTTLADGADPTMMLLPNVVASRSRAFTGSSIFRRGAQAEQFTGTAPSGATAFYYPGTVVNTPAFPSASFAKPTASSVKIVGTYGIIQPLDLLLSPCLAPLAGGVHAGLILGPTGGTTRREDSSAVILASAANPGAAPSFFGAPNFFGAGGGSTVGISQDGVKTLDDAAQVARTGDFIAGTASTTVHRVLMGTTGLIDWLNTEPYDSAMNAPANVIYRTELVRSRTGLVLWSSDTISARAVGADTIDADVTVPLGAYAAPNDTVYIRLRATATAGMAYDLAAGFHFVEENAYPDAAYKGARPQPATQTDSAVGIAIEVVPNPARASGAELRVSVRQAGPVSLAVYNMLGNRVLALPPLEAKGAGTYEVPVDLGTLGDGLYIVEARSEGVHGTARFTVMR